MQLKNQTFEIEVNPQSGALDLIRIRHDPQRMNWLINEKNAAYHPAGLGWGLGYFCIGTKKFFFSRYQFSTISRQAQTLETEIFSLRIRLKRRLTLTTLVENYSFCNLSRKTIRLNGLGIYTPFYNEQDTAAIASVLRCNSHVWAGGKFSYVASNKMGGQGPHLGLVVTKGALQAYGIEGRNVRFVELQTGALITDENRDWGGKTIKQMQAEHSGDTGGSNSRGHLILMPTDRFHGNPRDLPQPIITLKPNQVFTLAWELFVYHSWDHFFKIIKDKAKTVQPDIFPWTLPQKHIFHVNGQKKESRGSGIYKIPLGQKGSALINCISDYETFLRKRADVLIQTQRVRKKSDPRRDAFLPYNNATKKLLEDGSTIRKFYYADYFEGKERLGIGCFLIRLNRLFPQRRHESVIERFYQYCINKLQDKKTGRVFGSVFEREGERPYDYPWFASLCLEYYQFSGRREALRRMVAALKSMYQQWHYQFYALGLRMKEALAALKTAGLESEYADLKKEFTRHAGQYLKTGTNYPGLEVKYEQSVVAPAPISLFEMYQFSGEKKYLSGALTHLKILEAFAGKQPDFRMHDVPLRHWDSFWFGALGLWGDSYPHHWSGYSGWAFMLAFECTSDVRYLKMGYNALSAPLCQFTEKGEAGCAFYYPFHYDDKPGHLLEPLANDQEWAGFHYLYFFGETAYLYKEKGQWRGINGSVITQNKEWIVFQPYLRTVKNLVICEKKQRKLLIELDKKMQTRITV